MKAIKEVRKYGVNESVWAGKYKNSHNLPHCHYDCELLYVENGSLNVMCGKTYYVINKGDAFFINSEQVHFMQAIEQDSILTVILFDYNLIKPFADKLALANPILQGDYKIESVYKLLKKELGERQGFYEFKTANVISQLFIEIFRNEPTIFKPKEKTSTEKFKKLLDEIQVNFEFYSFENAADFMHMSTAYFSRAFHKEMGMTFTAYLNYIKIEKAVEMLKAQNSLSVTEVATACGFSTIRNFNRTFKEITGYSPTNLPKDYVINSDKIILDGMGKNPTLNECILIESCNKI